VAAAATVYLTRLVMNQTIVDGSGDLRRIVTGTLDDEAADVCLDFERHGDVRFSVCHGAISRGGQSVACAADPVSRSVAQAAPLA